MNERLRICTVVSALAVAAVLAPVVPGAVAQAAPVTVGGCPATSGSNDTGALRITFDDGALAGGTMVPLHDNTGGVLFPAPSDDAMSSPVCGLHRLADGSSRHEWLYCTDPILNTCATEALVRKGAAATGVGGLTDLDKARLAWVLENAIDNATAATRVLSQRLVWCVTEGAAPGAEAPLYFKNGTDAALRCPDWAAVDPTLDTTPTVAVTGPAAPLAAGTEARFAVTTDTSPLSVGVAGLTGLAMCPSATGATLAAGLLTIAAPNQAAPVELCATRDTAGTGTLTVTIAARTGRTLEFWQRNSATQFCQGMLSTETLSTTAATASAQAVFAAVAPTTSTTVGSFTTTTDPGVTTTVVIDGGSTTSRPTVLETSVTPRNVTLPRTGSSRGGTDAAWALVLLGFGVLLVAATRRPDRR